MVFWVQILDSYATFGFGNYFLEIYPCFISEIFSKISKYGFLNFTKEARRKSLKFQNVLFVSRFLNFHNPRSCPNLYVSLCTFKVHSNFLESLRKYRYSKIYSTILDKSLSSLSKLPIDCLTALLHAGCGSPAVNAVTYPTGAFSWSMKSLLSLQNRPSTSNLNLNLKL